ncbi:hypothetical protein GCM10009811_24290 [Nostocoides veronense]|uniref:GmrSD restriction endonucleases N-terminal domain-containing protein n=2 Tax=Nostocoides veronense TaxID=330836 RepID=A0ABN2LUD6_9MICO
MGADPVLQSFMDAQKSAVLEIADQGLLSLAHLVDSGAVDVSPKFQRRDRWTAEKQSLLIESFMTNIPVPPVYLAEDAARIGSYSVIDGKQRLTAISVFFANRLALRGLTRLPALNGLRVNDLPEGVRVALGMKNLRVTTLLRQSSEELKHEVFLRLNTGGEILNAQEIRNVAYRGPLNDLIYELAEDQFLRTQFKVVPKASPAYRKMTDAELVLRFLALEEGWRSFRGDLRAELDRFMMVHRFDDEEELSRKRRLFQDVMHTCEAIWGSDAFKRSGRDLALAGLFDAQAIAVAELTKDQRRTAIAKRASVARDCADLFNEDEYDEAVRRATNTPSRLKFRTQRTLDVLKELTS